MSLLAILDGAVEVSRIPLWIVGGYMALLMGLGLVTKALFRGTSSDYFAAGRSIGGFLLLMSVFGTTMTAFALVGSTGKAYDLGIGVYGLMASSSGLIHSLVFFLIGIRLWAIGKRYDYITQIQFFRGRFQSNGLGYLLFPVLVGLVIPYLLIGLLGAGTVMRGTTRGMFPETFEGGAIPQWITGLVVCGVVLWYIFYGGIRGAAWANAFQTMVFMAMGVVAFVLISDALGGVEAASQAVLERNPEHLAREGRIGYGQFLSYGLVPLSVGMFPHLFQHWLTAKSAKTFRLSVVCHPIFIMIVWVPCILIGIWATGMEGFNPPSSNATLSVMVGKLVQDPVITGLLTAGILAAIMSSLDSQFVCLGTMFTHDIVLHIAGEDAYTDRQKVFIGRAFIVAIVAVVYTLSLYIAPNIFDLAVWCFSGFASLFPLVFAALYWRRVTRTGAISCVLATVATWAWLFYRGLVARPEGQEGDFLVDFMIQGPGSDPLLGIEGMMPVVLMFLVSTVTLVVVSFVTQPPPKDVVDKYFIRPEEA